MFLRMPDTSQNVNFYMYLNGTVTARPFELFIDAPFNYLTTRTRFSDTNSIKNGQYSRQLFFIFNTNCLWLSCALGPVQLLFSCACFVFEYHDGLQTLNATICARSTFSVLQTFFLSTVPLRDLVFLVICDPPPCFGRIRIHDATFQLFIPI